MYLISSITLLSWVNSISDIKHWPCSARWGILIKQLLVCGDSWVYWLYVIPFHKATREWLHTFCLSLIVLIDSLSMNQFMNYIYITKISLYKVALLVGNILSDFWKVANCCYSVRHTMRQKCDFSKAFQGPSKLYSVEVS